MAPENKNFSSLLIEALRTKGISLEKLSQVTGVSERFLTALIGEEFDKLPAVPYVHGYLMRIAEALGLDGDTLWRDYVKQVPALKRSGKQDALPGNRFARGRVNGRLIAGIILAFLFFGYFGVRIFSAIQPPALTLLNFSPDTTRVTAALFTVAGRVEFDARLTVNGEAVYPEGNGDFKKSITLTPGFNTVTIAVKKLLGKEHVTTRSIFYESPPPVKPVSEPQTIEEEATSASPEQEGEM